MVLCGTKNGSSMASLEETFEAPLFLRVYGEALSAFLLLWNSFNHFYSTLYVPYFC